jgi:membrane fusion protein (multidrug efflux system)
VFTDQSQLEKYPLRIGMSLDTNVNLHDQNGAALSQTPRTEARFSTDVYQQELAKADQQIDQIIHANMAGQQ